VSRSSVQLLRGRERGTWSGALTSELAAVVYAAVIALLVGHLALQGPTFIPRVTVVNSSELDIVVDIAPARGEGSMWLTLVESDGTKATKDVIDQGSSWVFAFRSQGIDGGELVISRRDLESAGWRVTVPEEVVARLRERGATPGPGG
jgi:hypothetical protein